MREKFPADERHEEKRRAKNQRARENCALRMMQAPLEPARINVANPIENAVGLFLHAFLEPRVGQNRNKRKREEKSAYQCEAHGVRHGMKKLPRRTAKRVDRKITGNDHRNGIKDGPVHVASGRQDHFCEVVFLPSAKTQLAVDVLHHHDGAVNDDPEVDGADGKEIRGFAGEMQKNESEEQS